MLLVIFGGGYILNSLITKVWTIKKPRDFINAIQGRFFFVGDSKTLTSSEKKTPTPNCKWSNPTSRLLQTRWWLVEPTHLKNMLVKLDHFAKQKWEILEIYACQKYACQKYACPCGVKKRNISNHLDKNPAKTSKKPSEHLRKKEALEYDFPSFYPFFRG